jgi:hypothetical protein
MSGHAVPFSAEGYRVRAEECLRLASDTADQLIRSELLNLARLYARLAHAMETAGREEIALAGH